MNWGYKIFFSFVIFIGIIITMVVISMNQDISLVSEEYYKEEIAYQDQIDRMKRTSLLEEQPSVAYDRDTRLVTINVNSEKIEAGQVLFFRPSDAQKDKQIKFPATGSGKMVIPVEGWDSGLWKIKILWSEGGHEYYAEEVIIL